MQVKELQEVVCLHFFNPAQVAFRCELRFPEGLAKKAGGALAACIAQPLMALKWMLLLKSSEDRRAAKGIDPSSGPEGGVKRDIPPPPPQFRGAEGMKV